MKKLFTFSVILLLASGVFGQTKIDIGYQGTCVGTWENFKTESEHIKMFYLNGGTAEGRKSLDTIRINDYVNNFYENSVSGLRLTTYTFVDDDNNLYMISYDTTITITGHGEYSNITTTVVDSWRDGLLREISRKYYFGDWRATRDLYLWRWSDNKWNIASKPIQTDVWGSQVRMSNGKSLGRKQSGDTYFPRQEGANLEYFGGEADTYVKESDNGDVEIKLTCHIIGNGFIQVRSRMYYKILRFTPNGDGTYEVNLISTNK